LKWSSNELPGAGAIGCGRGLFSLIFVHIAVTLFAGGRAATGISMVKIGFCVVRHDRFLSLIALPLSNEGHLALFQPFE
jgi:hypothetical protein